MANLEYFSDEDVISFTLLDAHTVERLQREGDIKLPRKKVDIPKDERWNTKQMSSKLLQGILAGDDISTIANSLMQVIGNNAAAAVRNARTMVTGAENVGRLDSYEDLAEKGVVQKKVWIATADDRTRESHLLLDGEEVDIDKPFSNGLMYPADPSGDPAEVYNCRCSMRDHIVGFRRADGTISLVGVERDTTSHAGKIEDEIAQRGLEKVAEVEKFDISSVNVTLEDANEDWFEYENANAMAEYIRTGVMPEEDINGIEIPKQRQLELAKEAQLIQDEASSTKTSYKTLYRGMTMNEDEVRAMFTPNEMYTFDTLTATATDRNVAEIYSNVENSYLENPVSVIFEIQKPDGIYGYDRDGVEVIMPQGAQFRVVSNTMDENGVVHIGLYAKKGDNVLDDFVPESTPAEAPAEPVERPRVETQIKGVYKSQSHDTRGEWLQDTLGYSEEEADATLDAIRAYTMEGDVYSKIHNSDPAYASEIETLNNLIENPNMPVYDGEIYRGLHILDADGISAHDQIQLICESGTWTEGGITSFSSNMAKAKQFATGGATGHADEGLNVLIRIRSNQSGVPIQHLTGQRPEGEVLISSNVAQNGFNIVSYKFYEKDKELPWSGRVIHSRWCEIVVEE